MTVEDVLTAPLEAGQAVPTALPGAPYESWQVIHDDGRVEIGVWEVTPGDPSSRGAGRRRAEYASGLILVAGPATLVVGRGTSEAPRQRITHDHPTPASRNARVSLSISRAITSRWISCVPS